MIMEKNRKAEPDGMDKVTNEDVLRKVNEDEQLEYYMAIETLLDGSRFET